jgi:hypothetical protein
MDKSRMDYLIREGRLKPRNPDLPRIKSLIESARETAHVIRKVTITDQTATIVFRELYESIRQIGDARLWSLGFEPLSHDVSMEILAEMDIKERVKLNKLHRFRRTRNNANYRGYRISVEEAKEISEFWDTCADDMVKRITS